MNERVRAPALPDELQWLNTEAQTLDDLRGRCVLLAFWSAGSAYCHNLLEDLRFLQNKFSDGLSVIGVHTPKFEAERDPKLALKAVNRHFLRFPVAHDPGFVTWQHYGVSAWPTAVLIDCDGGIVDVFVGDDRREALEAAIEAVLEDAGANDRRVYDAAASVSRPEPRTPLAFPAGIAVADRYLYVADTGHNRILECDLGGNILRQFGSGSAGLVDGASNEASFLAPRGLAIWKDALYVADTGNHALRRIRMRDGHTETLCGTGRPAARPPEGTVAAADLALNAPWGLASAFDKLFIAMAGWHQVWEYHLGQHQMRAIAGSGRIGCVDGVGVGAAFAQPAGLALAQQTLFVADSAASAIRGVQLASGKVQTLVGGDLYEFGDTSGALKDARLQYPLALALDPRAPQLWIADSYNGCLKLLKPSTREIERVDLLYRLHQPAAMVAAQGALWLANTHAHEILRIEFEGPSVRRVPIGE